MGVDATHLLNERSRAEALARLESVRLEGGLAAAKGVLAGPGESFVRWLVSYLQSAVGMPFAFVGEVWGVDRDRVRTVAVCREGQLVDNFEYDLLATPCNEVIRQDVCAHPSGVASVYPDDELLEQMGIDAYVGVALTDPSGAPLGLMVVLDTGPIDENTLAMAVATLDLLRPRASAELCYRSTLWNMEMAVASTAGATLDLLVEGMAAALHVRCAFASVLEGDGSVRQLAVWSDGQAAETTQRFLDNTPEEVVYREGELMVPSGVQRRFPDDLSLRRHAAESYCAAVIRDHGGRPVGHVGFVHDREVSDASLGGPLFQLFRSRVGAELLRREAEAEQHALQRTLAHTQRQKSLGAMAGGIAHDFNNLLVGILGTADLMFADAQDGAREGLETIISASHQASALCRQLLVYAGQGSHVSQQIDLNQMIQEARSLISVFLPANCELRPQLAQGEVWTSADPVQLQQVLINLVKNGAEAVGENRGTVVVKTECLSWDGRSNGATLVGQRPAAGRYCCLTVADNGAGIDAAMLEKIFDPFFSTKSDGHGLGLAAVLGIVQRHGGALCVDSAPGRGSTFRVYLPAASGAEVRPSAAASAAGRVEGIKRVLVIDDEPMVRRTLCNILSRAGIASVEAEGGRQGVSLYADGWQSIDCVIVDLTMPDLGGGETLVELREINPRVSVLLSSGFPEDQLLEGLTERPNALLVKPFTASRLLEALAQLPRAGAD